MTYLKSIAAPILFFVLAIFSVSCNKEKPASGKAATSTVKKDGELIVYVNSDSLLNNYEYFKDVKSAMEDKSRRAQVDLTSKGNAFQKELNDYQRAAQTMSADQRATTEERLGRKQRELQSLNQNASSALANESAAENEKLYDRVAKYLKTYAKDKGFKLVLTYSKANPTVLFADESLDVTKEVVSGLNDEYKKDKP